MVGIRAELLNTLKTIGNVNTNTYGSTTFTYNGTTITLTGKENSIVDVMRELEATKKDYTKLTNPFEVWIKEDEEAMARLDKEIAQARKEIQNAESTQSSLNDKISNFFALNGKESENWNIFQKSEIEGYQNDLSLAKWAKISAQNNEFSGLIAKFLKATHIMKYRALC